MAVSTGLFVYIIRSSSDSRRHYVGVAGNVRRRLAEHNRGIVSSTVDNRPWDLLATCWFRDTKTARAFERDLKTDSGRAFAKRHFGPDAER